MLILRKAVCWLLAQIEPIAANRQIHRNQPPRRRVRLLPVDRQHLPQVDLCLGVGILGEPLQGVIEEVNAQRGKVRITVSIFGRQTPLEVDFEQIEKT